MGRLPRGDRSTLVRNVGCSYHKVVHEMDQPSNDLLGARAISLINLDMCLEERSDCWVGLGEFCGQSFAACQTPTLRFFSP